MPASTMSKTANYSDNSYDDYRFLPQLGFGSDLAFETIARYHRYLFRIYTPKSLPAVEDDSIFFVGARFDNKFAPQTPITSEMYEPSSARGTLVETATYEDCVQHLSWETRSRSPFISASFSFAWALWDAVRRFDIGVKHDVEIAVIDAGSLSEKAVTTLQLLRKNPSSASKRHPRHWRWCRFAQESQSVLIHGSIPRSAVLASVPLRVVIQSLPSYFLRSPSKTQHVDAQPSLPFDRLLAWDFSRKNASFRQFCQEMGDRFTRMPYQNRVREISIGSIRLAMAMLNPWFHRTVDSGDIHSAIGRIRDLSALIAHWPEQPGSRDYAEMVNLMRSLIQLLAEEVRGSSARTRQAAAEEISHLQKTVDGLLYAIHIQETGVDSCETSSKRRRSNSDSSSTQGTLLDEFSDPETFQPSSSPTRSRAGLKISIPNSSASAASSSSSPSSAAPLTPNSDDSDALFWSPLPSKNPSFARLHPVNPPSPNFSLSSVPEASPLVLPESNEHISSPPSPLQISIPLNIPSAVSSSGPGSASNYYTALKSPSFDFPLEKIESISSSSSDSEESYDCLSLDDYSIDADANPEEGEDDARASTLQEAVSFAVTGFLVGTMITLCILSSQRRTLLYMT